MIEPHEDPLLRTARLLVNGCTIILWVGIAALAVSAPLLLHARADVLTYMARPGAAIGATALAVLLVLMLAGFAAMLLLGVRFFGALRALLASVALGDPFVPANVRRLRGMAWLLLAMEALGVALGGYGAWLHRFSRDLDIGLNVSMTGLIAVVSLFVLARVFAHGAALRDEIEGTV